jgi:hypothetical protein
MKTGAIVKTLVRQLLEILDVTGRDVRPEFQDHIALRGFDDGDFVICGSTHIRKKVQGKTVADLM